jgi:hypothetical protein
MSKDKIAVYRKKIYIFCVIHFVQLYTMVRMHKKIRHHFSKKKQHYFVGLLSTLTVFVFLFAVFATTKSGTPHISELAFIEHSSTGVGSVIPASCNSSPPTNHFGGDCPDPAVGASIDPGTIAYGGWVSTMSMWSANAVRCDFYQNGIYVSPIPTSYTWYNFGPYYSDQSWSFVCYNAGDLAAAVTHVYLTVAGPPTVSASLSPTSIPSGGYFDTMSFSSSNAERCYAYQNGSPMEGWDPTYIYNTSFTWNNIGPYYSDQSWSFQCYNSANIASAVASVYLDVADAPWVTASITPGTVPYGGSFTEMTYNSGNTSYCNVYKDGALVWGSAPTSYTWSAGQGGPAYARQDWTFQCFNGANQSATAVATLYVQGAPTVSPSITPTTYVSYGGVRDILSYTSTNASYCDVYLNGVLVSPNSPPAYSWPSGSGGAVYENQTYTFQCGNAGSSVMSAPASVTLKVCPRGYNAADPDTCFNPLPVISISPAGTASTNKDEAIQITSGATDASSDSIIHQLEWQKPNGKFNWEEPSAPGGTVTYPSGQTSFPSGTNSSNLTASFTPNQIGTYKVRFAVQDNTFSNPNNFNGQGPRWTYSAWTYVRSINGIDPTIDPDPTDPPNKLRWSCANSNRATLITTNDPLNQGFTNKSLPPNYGSITISAGATYRLICINTVTGETKELVFVTPTLTATNIGLTSATINWNCNNPLARSISLDRVPGQTSVYNVTNGNRTDLDLTPSTEYIYTLRCFDQLNAGGTQVGARSILVITAAEDETTAFNIEAYVRASSNDSSTYSTTQPKFASTDDGEFLDWSYRLRSGGNPTTANSCYMDQRNDGGLWYPTPPYATNPTTYTFSWSSMSAADKSAFKNSFSSQHDWRITCYDSENKAKKLIWSLVKSDIFPKVIDATLNLNCGNPPPSITLQCLHSDTYELKRASGEMISSVGTTSATVNLIEPYEDTYKVICKSGGPAGVASREVLRTYSEIMCQTQTTGFIASPATIRSGNVSTLTWNIANPSPACQITATPVCSGTCSQTRIDAAAVLNNKLATENTDANDPYSVPGVPRTVTQAITEEAFNNGISGKGLGKKSLQIKYTTDFEISCGSASQKARVTVSNDNEG